MSICCIVFTPSTIILMFISTAGMAHMLLHGTHWSYFPRAKWDEKFIVQLKNSTLGVRILENTSSIHDWRYDWTLCLKGSVPVLQSRKRTCAVTGVFSLTFARDGNRTSVKVRYNKILDFTSWRDFVMIYIVTQSWVIIFDLSVLSQSSVCR